MYCIQHCFIYRPSDFTVSEDDGIEPRTVATSAPDALPMPKSHFPMFFSISHKRGLLFGAIDLKTFIFLKQEKMFKK
jgi:hypothetical protein